MKNNRTNLFAAALLGSATTCAPAMAQTVTTSANVSVSGGYSNNPYLIDDASSSGTATIRIEPSVVFADELGSTALTGSLSYTEFTNRYRANEAARLIVSGNYRLDEQTQANINSYVSTSRTPLQDTVSDSFGNLLEPDGLQDFGIDFFDPSALGERSRVTRFGTGAGIDRALDEVSALGITAAASADRYDGIGFDSQRYSGQVSYLRRVSPRTDVALIGGAQRVDYSQRGIPGSTIYSPGVSVTHRLDDRTTVSGGAGVNIVNSGGMGGTRTILSGQVQLCRRAERSGFCAIASQTAQPTALGSVNRFRSIGANYDAQLSQDSSISAGLRWSKTDGDMAILPLGTSFGGRELLVAQARYSHRLTDRISAFVAPSVSKISGNLADRPVDYGVNAGVTLRLGSQ